MTKQNNEIYIFLMQVALDSRVLGTEKHLLSSPDGYTWSDKVPQGSWHFNGELKTTSACWDTVLRLSKREQIPLPSPPHAAAIKFLAPDLTFPPWSAILPKSQYKKYFEELIEYSKPNESMAIPYYETVWAPTNWLFDSLKPAKVDGILIEKIIASSAKASPVVSTFKARAGGYAHPVVYDRFGTVTGRLTVQSGPNILLLKKSLREIIRPSTPDGVVASLDFSSLEARILLYESGKDYFGGDLYAMLGDQLGGVERNVVKAAVLAELYGSSQTALSLSLGIPSADLSKLIRRIGEIINTKDLISRLRDQHKRLGYIENKFGRRIDVQRPQDNIYVNYYAQSTGVDVSLLGFTKILKDLTLEGIRPLFILHDALILDVRSDRIKDVESVSSVSIPGYDSTFPLKYERM